MSDLPVLPVRGREEYPDRNPQPPHTNKPRGWHPGWPAGMPAGSLAVVETPRKLDGKIFKVRVDKRLAEHFGLFLMMIQEVGYPLIGADEVNVNGGKQGGIGSYNNRPIKGDGGNDVASEHSRGKALDIYTRSNPQRSTTNPHRLKSTWHPLAVRLAKAGDLEWGGHFHDMTNGKYSDPMHVQYRKWPEHVAASTAAMEAEYERILDELFPPEDPGVTPEQVKLLQQQLNELGADPQLTVDGVFGPVTQAALESITGVVLQRRDQAVTIAKETVFAGTKAAVQAAVEQVQMPV
jgi:hypothetical protein